MLSNDYFSQTEITRRINQRHRRRLLYKVHRLLSILITVGTVIALGVQTFFYFLYYGWVQDAILEPVVVSGLFLIVLWFFTYLHDLWRRSRETAVAEIDAQMREAREYELRRYELERDYAPDAAYRLADDGEWFDDINQTEYVSKPKRRLSP